MSSNNNEIVAPSDATVLKIKEAAALLRINDETLRRLSERGKIKAAFKVGGQWRYRKSELLEESK
jgi:excisionase family DNA binding protein